VRAVKEEIVVKMGDCRPMSARITERQCGINRARELFSCKHCFGLENITETAIEGEIVSKKGKCVKCKRPDMAIVAAGLCGKCYLDRKKEIEAAAASGSDANETPPAGNEEIISTPADHIVSVATETTAGSNPRSLLSMITPPPTVKFEGIFLDFSAHPGLLVDLEAISDNVPGDILVLCSMLVQGKLRGVVE
jgi:hypothetical protein